MSKSRIAVLIIGGSLGVFVAGCNKPSNDNSAKTNANAAKSANTTAPSTTNTTAPANTNAAANTNAKANTNAGNANMKMPAKPSPTKKP